MNFNARYALHRLALFATLLLGGCPPTTASCPTGLVLDSSGRCVAGADAGPAVDGSVRDAASDAATDVGPITTDGGTVDDAYVGSDSGPGDACTLATYYLDMDHDGHGDPSMSMSACAAPTGYVSAGDDCNDGCATCHPGGVETCDGVLDEDCVGGVDNGCLCTNGMMQACGMSSVGVCHMGSQTCVSGAWAACTGNVDPVMEICNGLDDDCNGAPDNGLGCVQGATGLSCTSVCGSTGTGSCTASCTIPTGAACTPPAEACNGTDDNCDGRADEGLGVVGAPICLGGACTVASPTRLSPHIVGLGSGTYGVVYATSAQDQFYMQRIAADGSAIGAVLPLSMDAHPLALSAITYAAAFDGTNVLVAFTHETSGDNNAYLKAFAPTTGGGAFPVYTLPLPAGRNVNYQVRVTDVSAGRVTVYVEQVNTSTSTRYVRRYRLNVAGMTPGVIYEVDALTDLAQVSGSGAWDVVTTSMGDVVVYRNTAGNMLMVRGPSGDATTGGFVSVGTVQTAAQQPNVTSIALAVPSSTTFVSATNPIGVAWQRDSGNGTYVAQLTSTSASTPSTPQQLSGSHGAPPAFGLPRWLAVFPIPNASAYMNTGFFYVASIEDDPSSSTNFTGSLAVWEVSTNPSRLTNSPLAVPTEASHGRYDISVASSGTSIRIAEENATGGIVTRELGCR